MIAYAPRRHMIAATSVGVALLLAVTACGGSSDSEGSGEDKATDGPQPALTKSQAFAALKGYSKTNNEANSELDAQLLAGVEDGSLYERSAANYRIRADSSDKKDAQIDPFWYSTKDAEFHIPRFDKGADRWFAAVAHSQSSERGKPTKKEKANQALMVFKEHPRKKSWRKVASVGLDDRKLPKIRKDEQGYATAVTGKAEEKFPVSGDDLEKAVNDNIATGGSKAGKIFRSGKAVKEQTEIKEGGIKDEGAKSTFNTAKNEHPGSFSLQTAGGGALTVFTSAHTQDDEATHPDAELTPGEAMESWVPQRPYSEISLKFACEHVAVVPSAGSKGAENGQTDSSVSLHGYSCGVVSATGEPK